MVGKPPNAKVVEMKTEKPKAKVEANNVLQIRERLLMSKAELARRSGLSVLTIDRVEKGMTCRMDSPKSCWMVGDIRIRTKH